MFFSPQCDEQKTSKRKYYKRKTVAKMQHKNIDIRILPDYLSKTGAM
jgi:hypothetical protein